MLIKFDIIKNISKLILQLIFTFKIKNLIKN